MAHSKECTTTYSSVQHPSLFKRVSFFLSGRDALRKRWTLVISPSEQWWRKRKELEERETKLSEGAPSPFPRPLHYFSDVYQNDQYQGVAMIFFLSFRLSVLCCMHTSIKLYRQRYLFLLQPFLRFHSAYSVANMRVRQTKGQKVEDGNDDDEEVGNKNGCHYR